MSESYEFTPPAGGWLARAYYTPLGDALRGRLTGRLNVRAEIAAARLDAPLPGLIDRVVRRTRLWRREQADVARELIGHFAAGLEAGRTAEQLAADFGPADQAARLIRRAKMRGRPLWWQILRTLRRLVLAIVGITLLAYGVWSARFYLGKPTIAHNYWHDINRARQVVEAERAWPLYRQAALVLGKSDVDPDWFDDGILGKHYAEAVAQLERNRAALDLIRQGAKKPRLGYLLGDPADHEAAVAAGQASMFARQDAEDNQHLMSALLYGIQELRRQARFLTASARSAALAGDGATALADVKDLVAIAEQTFEPKASLVEQLVGMALHGVAVGTAGRILADTPGIWSDDQLRDLAHRIAAFRGGSWSFDFDMVRIGFEDLLQRAYTDDGNGDGRITPEGLRMLAEYANYGLPLLPVAGSGVAAFMGSREENRSAYRQMLDSMIAPHEGVPWKWDRAELLDLQQRFFGPPQSSTERLRYWHVALLLPGVDGVFTAGEREHQLQDATLAAIALELWHRHHDRWPATLDELVPSLLPAVPVDRVDGKPLRYVVHDGQPLLYSVGEDGQDDGGSGNPDDNNGPHRYGALDPPNSPKAGDRDWILWPPLESRTPEEDEPPADPSEASE
jgi:hypothetical protein